MLREVGNALTYALLLWSIGVIGILFVTNIL